MQRQAILYGSFFGALALLALLFVGVPAAASGAAAAAARGVPGQQTVPIAPPVPGGGAAAPGPPKQPPRPPAGGGRRQPILADAASSPYCGWNQLYLPPVISPDHYDLDVSSDLRAPPYAVTGDVRVRLAPVTEVTPCVVLHSKGIKISSVQLIVGDEEAGDVIEGSVLNTTEYEQVVLKFGEAVPLAPAVVSSSRSPMAGVGQRQQWRWCGTAAAMAAAPALAQPALVQSPAQGVSFCAVWRWSWPLTRAASRLRRSLALVRFFLFGLWRQTPFQPPQKTIGPYRWRCGCGSAINFRRRWMASTAAATRVSSRSVGRVGGWALGGQYTGKGARHAASQGGWHQGRWRRRARRSSRKGDAARAMAASQRPRSGGGRAWTAGGGEAGRLRRRRAGGIRPSRLLAPRRQRRGARHGVDPL
jgi:hypothetical protein